MAKKSVKPVDDRPFYDVEVVDVSLLIDAIKVRILPPGCVKVDIAFLRNFVRNFSFTGRMETLGLKVTKREKRYGNN